MTSEFIATWQPLALALPRIVTAYLFIQHGTAKLLPVPHDPMFDGLPFLSLFGIAGVLEIIGGTLVPVNATLGGSWPGWPEPHSTDRRKRRRT
jgi:putative oxidoreductase